MAKEREAIERDGVRVTHPDRVLFPGQGLTKADLIDYLDCVSGLMLPHIQGRPLSLVRCPRGEGGKCFFQKHDSGGFPDALDGVEIVEASGEKARYFVARDVAGLVAAVQMGVLELHVWGSRAAALEVPDRLVFDLDPDEGLGFDAVRDAAFDLRDRLSALGLTTFPMLTGGKGIHVIAPLTGKAEWPEVKAFAKSFAARVAEEAPERYVAVMSKARRHDRVFVDYLRNERGSTAIAPYSTRARDGAPVAAPITWKEAETVKAANVFTAKSMPGRAEATGDPWPGYFELRQSLTGAMAKAVGAA